MAPSDRQNQRTLGAILLNPPLTSGQATMRHLQVAADVLGCGSVGIANLFAIPTRSVTAINEVGRNSMGWESARPKLEDVLATSTELVAGWGVSGLYGLAAANFRAQISWLHAWFQDGSRLPSMWTLDGESRHPSRWHQYVSDRHGRATGATFRERLESVLRHTSIPMHPPACPRS